MRCVIKIKDYEAIRSLGTLNKREPHTGKLIVGAEEVMIHKNIYGPIQRPSLCKIRKEDR